MSVAASIGIPLAAFAGVSALASIAGAANLGTALGIGQVAFTAVLGWVLMRA